MERLYGAAEAVAVVQCVDNGADASHLVEYRIGVQGKRIITLSPAAAARYFAKGAVNNLSLSSADISLAPVPVPILFFAGMFGLVFGSFLNVLIYRLPRGLSVVYPGSACPRCKTKIKPRDNIPVMAWLLLQGRCRTCHAPISARYAIVEILVGVLFVASLLFFGLSLAALKYCIFGFLLLGLIFTDAEKKWLPDAMTIPGLVLGVLFSGLVPVSGPAYFLLIASGLPNLANIQPFPSVFNALLGAAFGAGFIYIVGAGYFYLQGIRGMGFGDVKLMGMVGAFLGMNLAIFTMLAASLVGLCFGLPIVVMYWQKRKRRFARTRTAAEASARAWQSARRYQIPFGVFLGAAALIAAFAGGPVIEWYSGLLG